MSCGSEHCLRCGSADNWEIQRLIGSAVDKEGKNVFTYMMDCARCGRHQMYRTDDPDALPERVKTRDDLFKDMPNIESARELNPESDTIGFSKSKLKGRLYND